VSDDRSSASVDPPVGTIVAFAGSAAAVDEGRGNWLVCDGRSLSRYEHGVLFSAIGTAWGGDGEPTFFLPDLRGQFLRGVDKAADGTTTPQHDADRDERRAFQPEAANGTPGNAGNEVGSFQDDEFLQHIHRIADPGHDHEVKRGFLANGEGGYGQGGQTGGGGSDAYDWGDRRITTPSTTGIQLVASGGSETRPVNAYVYWLIRYR